MAKDQYLERLKAVPLFASLSKRELGLLLHQADHVRYPARFRVVREGEPGTEFWMVVEGELAVERGGQEVDRIGPGDYFGELAVIDRATRDATVVAKTPVELLLIDQRRFWATLEGSPVLMRKIILGLAQRLHDLDAKDTAARSAIVLQRTAADAAETAPSA